MNTNQLTLRPWTHANVVEVTFDHLHLKKCNYFSVISSSFFSLVHALSVIESLPIESHEQDLSASCELDMYDKTGQS